MPSLLFSQPWFLKCQLAGWAKKILIIVNTKYPSELRGAVHHFLQVCSWIFCSLFAHIVKMSSMVWTLDLFNRITKHILRKMTHCIGFYVRCWMGIWIHHLISLIQQFGLPCIIQRYLLTFSWILGVYNPKVCVLVFNGIDFLLVCKSFKILIWCGIGWCSACYTARYKFFWHPEK